MAGFGVANERLRALEELEREIGASLQSAGARGLRARRGLREERAGPRRFGGRGGGTSGRPCPAQVATGQPHEGSSYAARKSCQLALNRLEHARRRLAELARACESVLE
ncbi:MED11 polymerase, partial [Eulacestoma nigropectus]|nr:MED11 polymerase [Eulacestoma nigropectus]